MNIHFKAGYDAYLRGRHKIAPREILIPRGSSEPTAETRDNAKQWCAGWDHANLQQIASGKL